MRKLSCSSLLAWAAVAFASFFFIAFVGPARADGYRLGPGDTVEIGVLGHPDLSGPRRVQADGSISLPVAGWLPASGHDTRELSEVVRRALAEAGVNARSVTVEVAAHRPFYVLGDVQSPGSYAFRPGLTVNRALALAGGARRLASTTPETLANAIRAHEALDLIEQGIVKARLRQARLEAEGTGATALTVPEDLASLRGTVPWVDALIRAEQKVLDSRATQMGTLEAALAAEAQVFGEEIDALTLQREAGARVRDLIDSEVGKYQALRNERLATSSQLLTLQREQAVAGRSLHEIDAFLARARQNVASTQTRLRIEQNDARADALADLLAVQRDLVDLVTRQRRQVQVIGAYAEVGPLPDPGSGRPALTFEVVRESGERVLDAATDLPLAPGDILEVRTRQIETNPGLTVN